MHNATRRWINVIYKTKPCFQDYEAKVNQRLMSRYLCVNR
jgi:hypothetical protein